MKTGRKNTNVDRGKTKRRQTKKRGRTGNKPKGGVAETLTRGVNTTGNGVWGAGLVGRGGLEPDERGGRTYEKG